MGNSRRAAGLLVSQMTQMERDDDLALKLLAAIQRGIEFEDAGRRKAL
jgi:hypothetical protein